jgi:hypothetical protein
MTAESTRTIAGILAQRLGVEPNVVEGTLADEPFAAAMALSLLNQPRPATCDPAETVRFVATLVGACPICLGEDMACHECGGKGGPGARDLDAAALVAWLAPALRELGLCIGRPRRQTRRTQPRRRYES